MIVAEQDSVTNDDLTIPPGLDRRGEPRAERREDIKSIRSRAARLGYTVKRRLDLLESSQETGQPIQIESPCGTPLFQIEPPTNEPVHAQTGFDYSGLTANASELAKRAAAKIQQHQRRTSLEIIEIGTDLIKVKGALEHGHFIAWLEAEFGWTDRTARNYMRAALVFGAKSETVSVLPPATIYLLSAPSTPETTTGEIVAELESGGQPDLLAIEARVQTARKEAREQRRKELKKKKRAEDKKNHDKWERQRLQEEAEEQERKKQAAVTAQKIIDEIGVEFVARVLDAAKDWLVHRALRDAVSAARSGAGA